MNEIKACVSLQGEAASIKVEVLGREHPGTVLAEDAEWLRCAFTLELQGVRAVLDTSFMVGDFVPFTRQLKELLSSPPGLVSFKPYEDTVALEIELTARGQGEIRGLVSRRSGQRVTIDFSFATDQTFLRETHRDLMQLLSLVDPLEKSPPSTQFLESDG